MRGAGHTLTAKCDPLNTISDRLHAPPLMRKAYVRARVCEEVGTCAGQVTPFMRKVTPLMRKLTALMRNVTPLMRPH